MTEIMDWFGSVDDLPLTASGNDEGLPDDIAQKRALDG
jgi:hypothetical protein